MVVCSRREALIEAFFCLIDDALTSDGGVAMRMVGQSQNGSLTLRRSREAVSSTRLPNPCWQKLKTAPHGLFLVSAVFAISTY